MLLVGISRAVLVSLIAAVLIPLPGFGVEATAQQQDEPQSMIAPSPPTPQKTSEYGAIAFTPDGSFFSVWKITSRVEAEDKVRTECSGLGRGACEAVSFRGEICTAIATGDVGKQRKITYAGGGLQPADAEKIALSRCNGDRRARGSCHLRTTVCGDGRRDSARAQ
jgi:hypothetical protein